VVVFVVREEDVLVVAGGAAKIAASAKRRSGVCLSDFTPPINFTYFFSSRFTPPITSVTGPPAK
jgi:hypothetical protein